MSVKLVSKATFETAAPKLAENLFACLNTGVGNDGWMKAAAYFVEDNAGQKILETAEFANVAINPFGWGTSTKKIKTVDSPVLIVDLISAILVAYNHALEMEKAMQIFYQTESPVGVDWSKIAAKVTA